MGIMGDPVRRSFALSILVFAVSTAFVVGTIAWHPIAHAQANESSSEALSTNHLQQTEKMLELMGLPAQVDRAAKDILKLYNVEVTDASVVDDNVRRLIEAYQRDLEQLVSSVLSWDGIKQNYINNYAARMTPEAVNAVVAFYQSDVGVEFSSAQASASAELALATQHLFEADLKQPLTELSDLFREGLQTLSRLKEQQQTQ